MSAVGGCERWKGRQLEAWYHISSTWTAELRHARLSVSSDTLLIQCKLHRALTLGWKVELETQEVETWRKDLTQWAYCLLTSNNSLLFTYVIIRYMHTLRKKGRNQLFPRVRMCLIFHSDINLYDLLVGLTDCIIGWLVLCVSRCLVFNCVNFIHGWCFPQFLNDWLICEVLHHTHWSLFGTTVHVEFLFSQAHL